MAKILLVEDDNNLREIFDMRLQAEGYKTVTAGDGEEALVVAVKEKPDLVIADVMMPKLSGFEMVENMRASPELANVKVIMMTALGQAEDQARGEKLGVVKYLVKSQVTLEDFARIVKEVMPPDQAAADKAATAPDDAATPAPPDVTEPSINNNQAESETTMQDDAQTPTNPTPDAGAAPAGDAAPMANPISDTPASPLGDTTGGEQQSTAEETSAVQDQIDNFENNPAPDSSAVTPDASTTDTPADGSMATPAADAAIPQTSPPVDSPAPDAGAAPAPADPNAPIADPSVPAPETGNGTDPSSNAL
jgi:CheY-like chemotaxis protein